MFNFTLARSMPRATTWSMVCLVLWGQAKLGLGGRPREVYFSVSGVNCLVKVWLEPGVRPSLAWADAQYQVRFSVSGVNLNHAVQVGDGLLVPTFVHQLRSAVEALLGVAEP